MAVFDRASITRAYDRWAPVYDLVFGKVVETGTVDAVVNSPSHEYTKRLIASVPSLDPHLQSQE